MASNASRTRAAADYKVACICPMDVELAPVEAMLDEIHDPLPTARDQNAYTLGQIGVHDIVIAIMPETGNNAAATVVTQLLNDFPSIRFGLLVGIGGGVPGAVDVRLGDIVVSQATDTFGGVVQYDLGKRIGDGTFRRTGQLNKPPSVLSANVRKLQSQHQRQGHQLLQLVSEMLKKYPNMQPKYSQPSIEDVLFEKNYQHQSDGNCEGCDIKQTVRRPSRSVQQPVIHHGTIGSANIVLKDAVLRDQLRKEMNLLCVDMEAAGLMNDFPCLVIRGICDYADSHKNKEWQPYAAALAAAYMKTLLLAIPAQDVSLSSRAVGNTTSPFNLGVHLTEAPVIEAELFVGRSTDLQAMEKILQPQREPQEHCRLVLGGMGGVGKTQLAIAYAKRHSRFYESVFWLNAASEITLKQSVRQMAERVIDIKIIRELHEDELRSQVMNWLLNSRNTRWLLIFDNYDDPDSYSLGKYCPYGAHGSALITTRFAHKVQGKQLLLRPLSDIDEGLQILMVRSMRDDVSYDIFARKLVERVQGLPLALATAGAYLKQSPWTFKEYLESYEKQSQNNNRQSSYLPEYRDQTLYTTWDITYLGLNSDFPATAKLLRSFAFFDNQNIHYELFRFSNNHRVDRKLTKLKSKFSHLFRAQAEINSLEELSQMSLDEFERAMHVLTEFCLVEVRADHKGYSIHRCVHDWVLANLNVGTRTHGYWFAFDRVADFIAGIKQDHYDYALYNFMAPHAARLSHVTFDTISENASRKRLEDMHNIAGFLGQQLQLAEAERMYKRALAGYEKALGAEHTSTLNTVNNLGNVYHDQGKLAEAEQMYLRALAGNENALGAEHTLTLRTVNNLGNVYHDQGKLAEAEQIYLRALAGKEKVLGAEHTLTLNTVNNLGNVYRDQGKLAEAEQMYLRALAGNEKAHGADHTSTLDTVNNLGNVYLDQSKLAEAEQMYLRALAGYDKVLGAEHTLTLNTVNNLGNVYQDQGKLAEAEQIYLRALAGYEKVLGAEHTLTLNTVNNLGNLYRNQGKLAEAEQMYLRALAGREKALGAEHTSTLDTVNNLGALYLDQSKLAEAEQMYLRALAGNENALGAEHTLTLRTVNNLGNAYHDQGKLAEAEQIYLRALAGKEKVLGAEHTSTLNTVDNLGNLYRDQGKLAEAEQMYLRALAGYEKALGAEHTSTLRTVDNLGNLYCDQGKLAEAEQMYLRALAGNEKALGAEHTSTLRTVNNLGVLYHDQGKLAEAERMYLRALAGKKKVLGAEHTSTLNTVNNLGNLYRAQGKLADAEQMFERARVEYQKVLHE